MTCPIQLQQPVNDGLSHAVKHGRTLLVLDYAIEVESLPGEAFNIAVDWMHEGADHLHQQLENIGVAGIGLEDLQKIRNEPDLHNVLVE